MSEQEIKAIASWFEKQIIASNGKFRSISGWSWVVNYKKIFAVLISADVKFQVFFSETTPDSNYLMDPGSEKKAQKNTTGFPALSIFRLHISVETSLEVSVVSY